MKRMNPNFVDKEADTMIVKHIPLMTLSTFLAVLCSFCIFESTVTAEAQYHIAMMGYGGTTVPFWKMAEKGLNDMAAKYSELEVTYHGSQDHNVEQFVNTLQSVIASQPDAVVCPLIDPMYMDEILHPAIADGLPVIAFHDADLREPAESRIPVFAFVGEDNYTFGKVAAQETLQRFTPKRAIFCNHAPGTEKVDALGRGWVETMQTAGIEAEQLNVEAGGGFGTELLATYLLSHPETDTIFTADFGRALAFIMRLEADGYQVGQEINIIQLGSDEPVVLDFIKQGRIAFALDQQPYLQSYLGATLAYAHLKDGFTSAQKSFSIDPVIITQENMAEMPIFKLPDLLLDNLKSAGVPEDILKDLQSLEEK
jgi:simple sugar transport system substrate-binding protein